MQLTNQLIKKHSTSLNRELCAQWGIFFVTSFLKFCKLNRVIAVCNYLPIIRSY